MQSGSYRQHTIPAVPHYSTQQTAIDRANTISGLVVIILPVVVVCAILGCRKRRAIVLRQRIQHLNRLWHLDSSKNLS